MNRCTKCVVPDTRPDTPFDETGQCSACRSYAARPEINWAQRREELIHLLGKAALAGAQYDVVVPSSGGKDSTYQAITLKEMGARVLAVTASTCHLTPIGRKNLDNLARHVTTIEVTPNRTVRAKLNRIGLEMVGDISWPEHAAIFSVPFRIAAPMGIPLVMYGECPQNQYGGPPGSIDARTMTRRWVSEFGGFLGLRAADLATMTSTESVRDYQLPENMDGVEAHFLGAYLPWDSHLNAHVAIEHGFHHLLPHPANLWSHENLDNAQTGLHDHLCYRKYGYGRLAAQASVDIRTGDMTRERAMELVRERDGLFPYTYAGVSVDDVLGRIGMTMPELDAILDRFTNRALFSGEENRRPILKEFA